MSAERVAVTEATAHQGGVPERRPFSSDTGSATPALARAWATAVLNYWRAGLDRGTIDPKLPLYLIDLAPCNGQLAWLMLACLREGLASAGLALQPCYLLCATVGTRDTMASGLHLHPYFSADLAHGWIDGASLDVDDGLLRLAHGGDVLEQTGNPIVILSLSYFQQLPADLFAVHHGDVLQGEVAPGEDGGLVYAWTSLATDGGQSHLTGAGTAATLLRHYVARCASAALSLPLAACGLLDALDRLSASRSLLLAVERGCCDDQAVRLGALTPPDTWHAGDPAPALNLHAISLHQQQRGAWTWHQQIDEGGLVLYASCTGAAQMIDERIANAIIKAIASAHPDDQIAMIDAAAAQGDAAGLLALLRLSDCNPQVLRAGIRAMIAQPPALTELARRSWRIALSAAWQHYLPGGEVDDFCHNAGLLAAQMGDWGQAKACFGTGLALYGDNAPGLYLLACCEAASGASSTAGELIERALALEPGYPPSIALAADLAARRRRHAGSAYFLPHAASANGLCLEPLGAEHAESMLYQLRDEQIAILTRLPEMHTLEQAQAWIAEQHHDPARAGFAVVHQRWGFVGSVSAHCNADAAYFHFWIGTDFQDAGFGQTAATLLFDMLAGHGLTSLFTSAYRDNLRSLHALERLGFVRLAIRAREPDQELVFLCRPGSDEDIKNAAPRLRALCHAIASPFQFHEHGDAASERVSSVAAAEISHPGFGL